MGNYESNDQYWYAEKVGSMIKALKSNVVLGGHGEQDRAIMESKAWYDVEKLGSDRSGYRMWNSKFQLQ